jgi:hypothetical protein
MENQTENTTQRCRATTSKGKQCSGFVIADSEYCFTHSPEHAEERAQARQRGGKNRAAPPNNSPFPDADINTARGLATFVTQLIQDTWTLQPSISRARTLALLVNVQKDIIVRSERESVQAEFKARQAERQARSTRLDPNS